MELVEATLIVEEHDWLALLRLSLAWLVRPGNKFLKCAGHLGKRDGWRN